MERNHDIDFIKGGLVIMMIFYHWINYFVSTTGEVYRYLRFITPSFILITGFLITSVYAVKFRLDDPRLIRRLLQRGLKLLLLFTALNLIANAMISRNYNGASMGIRTFLENSFEIYILGTGLGAVFDVLVPISYVLLAAPFLMRGSLLLKCPLPLMALGCFGVILILAVELPLGENPSMMGMGFLGMALGGMERSRLERVLSRTGLLAGLYLVYLAALIRWNVVYAVQVVGVCANLWLFYWLSRKCGSKNPVSHGLIELGKYSLFAYIFHVAVLQVLRLSLRHTGLSFVGLLLPLPATAALTFVAVAALGAARARSTAADRIYRTVFA